MERSIERVDCRPSHIIRNSAILRIPLDEPGFHSTELMSPVFFFLIFLFIQIFIHYSFIHYSFIFFTK